MKKIRNNAPGEQRGSMYTTMIMVALLGFFVLAALKIAPGYVDDNVIVNTMESMAANNNMAELSINEVRTNLMRTLNTNRIENFDAGNVVLTREEGRDYIDINYEYRAPLFYNIEAVVVFSHRFDKF